ncbi:MAG: PLP-dependent aminotransferase family protein, partial [Rhodocyclales bacterium]|nr:PLP-dependent aminotransferase family protein [Rhodocyclales bacterium]
MDFALFFSRLDADPALPRQRRLYDLIRGAILDGTLAAGTRLPGSRALASDLGIARNSVLYAYERLAAEGFLASTRQGTRVLRMARAAAPRAALMPAADLSQRGRQLARRAGFGGDGRAFAPGFPDCAAFPRRQWLACLNAAWRRAGPAQLGYGAAAGEPALRAAIADYLLAARGVRCTAEQVLVTAGSQAGLDACARVLADAGATAWVENPGYVGARAAFRMADLVVHAIAVDADGMAPTARDWQRHPPRLIHVTPSHQFPLGATLSLPRRLDLIRRAAAGGAWIVEDDYDSDFRHEGRPLAAMQGLVENAPVIYAGTFSRMLFPALRIGYLVVPAALAPTFAAGVAELTWPGHAVEQQALA